MIKSQKNRFYTGASSPVFSINAAREAMTFHRQIPGYQPTPLVSLEQLAARLGVKAVLVKDESRRFGLNAFKVLGGSYALGKILAGKLNLSISEINFSTVSALLPEPQVFTTATAGNHGTGVAWAAREMGQKAVVYMPKGAARSSVERIRALGADCIVTDVNYDDTVRLASRTAEENNWTLVQDTAWEGYEKIPTWISQGYMTMASEALIQLQEYDYDQPTHIFLQAGVGAMAGGVLGFYADALGADSFTAVITEPEAADCVFRSAETENARRVAVQGDLNSIMAGLACGEVNPVTWDILRDASRFFMSVADTVSATGMRVLGNPLQGDERIISGESGAINMGVLYALMTSADADIGAIKNEMGLDENSIVLLFSTEGDTNPERYRRIVWDGQYAF
ncbi:diaminopropionate ammonia-lyase [Enterobacter hormaechei]|uniref:Diaminopropionate ammonia-lyase n=1 Tax=Enterobacter hormaechei subsp. steigerwaltii TaxID=299766 RepID=A0AAE4J730_9ENTR|nr:diaminopropionate ammonia-lyase [Enterobacter hormaechei]MDS0022060.1 diaminopropionate ammonia-lyase [Enterobacter hormaechei subsp. steigerwaltii]MDS0109869.1 diaminopropionate ammonia-lyase [Enterobacter hormaechei subsp. steigerwaltii]